MVDDEHTDEHGRDVGPVEPDGDAEAALEDAGTGVFGARGRDGVGQRGILVHRSDDVGPGGRIDSGTEEPKPHNIHC